jgi:hypothetical protein
MRKREGRANSNELQYPSDARTETNWIAKLKFRILQVAVRMKSRRQENIPKKSYTAGFFRPAYASWQEEAGTCGTRYSDEGNVGEAVQASICMPSPSSPRLAPGTNHLMTTHVVGICATANSPRFRKRKGYETVHRI